ncbi:hypothetical protein [Jiella marina]|uniref:hypothetical protein n=1 Tax=Jiella sp. LLJ827 TaxID=2917712 RepID=UPI002100F17B|nr:hypothetical protein [Jiella sp. LLJ827]MCQ0987353.1 hypothetical protein [Jiella sp. LLJ827]
MEDEIIPDPSNRRRWQRRRTRLRPVKLLTIHGQFIEDCLCVDVSSGGMRLSRHSDRPLPKKIIVFEVSDKTFQVGSLAWLSGNLAGLQFASQAMKATPAQLQALGQTRGNDAVYYRK